MENISNSNQNQRRSDDCSAELSIEKKAEAEEDRSPLSMQSDGCINDKENSISNSNSNSNNSNEEIGGGNNLNGRWDKKEHLLFLKGCLLYENNWKKVQKYVKTRSSSQIRSHAQKYLIKLSKKHQALVTKTINGHSNTNLNGNGSTNGNGNGSGANYAFKSMSNEQLDAFIDNINESSNEMNSIEEYILAIFQPELKFQEALNAANINQRRGRKTEPKKKQRIFCVAKCYDIRDYKKNIKNDELLTYLNSNDPQDLSKLLSMVTNSYVNDLLKNGTTNPNTNTNGNSNGNGNGNGNTTVMSSNSFTLPQKDSLSQLVFNNIVNTTQQQQPNAIPLSFPITSMPLVPPLTMPMTTPSSSSSPYFPLPVSMPLPLPVSVPVPGQFPMMPMPMPSIPTTIEEANKLNMFNMPTFPFQIPHHPQSQQNQSQSQVQGQQQQQQQQSPSHQTQGMPNIFNIPGHNVDVLMSTLQKMATHPTSKFY